MLKTPEGDKPVKAGDLIFCPCGEAGAHRLTNTSDSETMVYLDFDTVTPTNVCVYPDSRKVAVWSKSFGKAYRIEDSVAYYDREDASDAP